MSKVLVALSGGVDSSVAAHLLLKLGYQVEGVFLDFWQENKGKENRCCSPKSKKISGAVAKQLGIKFRVINLSRLFKKEVVDDYLKEQLLGRTPNPCVKCNKKVKLSWLIEEAKRLGFDFLATGHYLQKVKAKGHWKITRGVDRQKDQSYFLYNLDQDKLKNLLFPLGKLTKNQVRLIAKKNKIITYNLPESQDICFIPDDNILGFIQRNSKGSKPGMIVDDKGRQLGKHQGLPFYTIGQRQGLGIGGSDGPYYVVGKKVKSNKLIVTNNKRSQLLWHNQCTVKRVNWISGQAPTFPLKVKVKTRSVSKLQPARVSKKNNLITIKFNKPIRAVTPGQSAVFYQNEQLLGGGVII